MVGYQRLTEDCGQLYQQSDAGYLAAFPEILVPYDGLGYALGLRDWRVQFLFQQVEGEVTAIEFKGHQGSGDVLFRGADVVEEAGEEVGLIGDGKRVCG